MDQRSSSPFNPEDRLPYGWAHGVWKQNQQAVKIYEGPDAAAKAEFEASVLRSLEAILPVPRVVSTQGGELRMDFIDGVNGQPALESGSYEDGLLMFSMAGDLLRQLHETHVSQSILPGSGPVVVHGDFSWYNLIVSEDRRQVLGFVDWEKAHLGDGIQDLSWLEWTVRTHWEPRLYGMDAFFSSYGDRPDWPQRKVAMVENIDRHIRTIAGPRPDLIPKWQTFRAKTMALEPLEGDNA